MKSPLADTLRAEQAAFDASLTPAERLEAALKLGQQAIEDYVRNFGVDSDEAVRILRRRANAGRRYSACMDDERSAELSGR